MPAIFPTLSAGAITLSPIRSLAAPVEIVQFMDSTEQRWPTAPLLYSWSLNLRLRPADMTAVQDFFDTVKGAYDSTWTFPFDGTNYTNMVFESDDLVRERKTAANIYYASVKVRQCKPMITPGTGPSAWPNINGAVITQYPYSETRRWKTLANRMPNGLQYAWNDRNFPIRLWNLAYPMITPSEAGTLLSAYVNAGGAWRSFAVTDPRTGVTYSNCRVDSPGMAFAYNGTRQIATSVVIAELVT